MPTVSDERDSVRDAGELEQLLAHERLVLEQRLRDPVERPRCFSSRRIASLVGLVGEPRLLLSRSRFVSSESA